MADHLLDIYGAHLHVATDRRQWAAFSRKHKGVELEKPDSEGMCTFVVHEHAGRNTPHLFMFIDVKAYTDPLDLAETSATPRPHRADAGQQRGAGVPRRMDDPLAAGRGQLTRRTDMALIYDFKLGPTCAGLEAVVTETLTGVAVDDSPVTLDSAGSAQLSLVEGSYVALVAGSTRGGIRWGDLSTNGALNATASIEAAMLAPEPA